MLKVYLNCQGIWANSLLYTFVISHCWRGFTVLGLSVRYVTTMIFLIISYRMPVILKKQKLSLMYKLLSNELGYFIVNLGRRMSQIVWMLFA